MRKFVSCIFAMIIISSISYSQQDVYLSYEKIVYTPTRYDIEVKNLPLSCSVITDEEIQNVNLYQTTDILEQIPGVFIMKTSAFGRADVNIRGLGNNGRQLGIFIDGRPDKMSIMGCSVTHTLPFNNVEKIEIIRGPESVLYGGEAFGGILNIITRKTKRDFEASLNLYGGSYNTQIGRFQLGQRFGKFNYFVSADRRYSDGHIENSSYKATDFSGNLEYNFLDGSKIDFSGKYFDGLKYEPKPAPLGTWNDYKRGSFDLSYNKNFKFMNLTTKIYRTFGEHKFSDGWHSKDFTYGVMVYGNSMILENNTLSYGIDFRNQLGEVLSGAPQVFLKEYKKYDYGIYFDDKQKLFKKFTFNFGLRYHYDEYFKDFLVPKVGIVFDLSRNITLRTLWSNGFRPPHINDLFLFASSNLDLKPEKTTNIEFGLRKKVYDILYFDITMFNMKGEDLIQVISGKKQNIGKFDFDGLELTTEIKPLKWLNFYLSYGYLDTKEKVVAQPKNKIVFVLNFVKDKFSGSLFN
ncbi:MAG: TonB-dependent receptor plug domain-containing protein, partial [Endomicrobiia bacterium]